MYKTRCSPAAINVPIQVHLPKTIFKDNDQCGNFVHAACEAARKTVEENDHNSIFTFGYPIQDLDFMFVDDGHGNQTVAVDLSPPL